MSSQLVEIHPRELKFMFEVKKQSSCTVHLGNATDHYVAFKVKTTSPKKYCVKPNVGIIKPKSTCDFIVIMQAQKSAPLEIQCKDKFLVQTTVVAFGTTESEITPGMFLKDGHKHIEETKLRVALITSPTSESEPPANVIMEQETSYETSSPKQFHSSVLLPVNGVMKQDPSHEMPVPKDKLQNGIENFPPDKVIKKMEPITNNVNNIELESTSSEVMDNMKSESRSKVMMDNMKSVPVKDNELPPGKNDEPKQQVKDVEEAKLKLTLDIEELRSKITTMDFKLVEAQSTINTLKEEKSSIIREKELLERELVQVTSRTSTGVRKVRAGFPPLFVCMVSMISLMVGFWFRA